MSDLIVDWLTLHGPWLEALSAGVALVAVLIAFFKWLLPLIIQWLSRKNSIKNERDFNNSSSSTNSSSSIIPATEIDKSIHKILKEIRSLPPLQQADKAKHYLGLHVRFEGKLFHLSKRPENMVYVVLEARVRALDHTEVDFRINLDDYPKFKLIDTGTPITVNGKLANIPGESGDVTLTDVTFE